MHIFIYLLFDDVNFVRSNRVSNKVLKLYFCSNWFCVTKYYPLLGTFSLSLSGEFLLMSTYIGHILEKSFYKCFALNKKLPASLQCSDLSVKIRQII
jgi:hypothetical protein